MDRFDELFGNTGSAPVVAPRPAPTPAPVRAKEPQALTLLKGEALIAYLKKSPTVKLTAWLQARVGYEVPADWERGHVLAVLTGLLVPLTDEDKQRNYDQLMPNALRASAAMVDPDGTKSHAAAQARKLAYSKAGKLGADGTKARRQAAGVQVGSKYSDDEVRTIRWMCKHGWNDKQVAEYFHNRTQPAMIWAIRTGVSYKRVTGEAATGPEAPAK